MCLTPSFFRDSISISAPDNFKITSVLFHHRPGARRADVPGIAREPAVRYLRLRLLPCLASLRQFVLRDLQIELPAGYVYAYLVAVLYQRYRAALHRLRAYVPDARALRPAGEPAVGDERDRLGEAHADDGRGRRKHLAHARPALRPLVAYDDHVPAFYLPGKYRGHRRLL